MLPAFPINKLRVFVEDFPKGRFNGNHNTLPPEPTSTAVDKCPPLEYTKPPVRDAFFTISDKKEFPRSRLALCRSAFNR